ncbi:hypothetical protein CEP54_003038 [Fusarium duplospermum]|uniref:Uncharacterized protein n=1 Tax=Fusarium duplospermum TaxID=1325734 RepID=A0A428QRQ8_9HYPO|nr:hypothetical protein CEP54_003038 [Fusarium duplospermum]
MIMRPVLLALASAIAITRALAASNDAATPEDVLNSMKDVGKLSADTHSHAKEIGTDFNRKHFILGFGHRQLLLVITLISEPRSIESGGFDGYFEDCFTRLKPALTGFVKGLADYAPNCRDKILKENSDLEWAFDEAIKKIKARWGARRAIPVDIPIPLI